MSGSPCERAYVTIGMLLSCSLGNHRMSLSDSSVRRWVSRLQAGDEAAAQRLWEVFFDRLVHLAHQRLQVRHRRVIDAEDVALSAFGSFCKGVEQQRFPQLTDQHDLWRLLVSITVHKVLHVVRDQKRIKRGGLFRELNQLAGSSDAIAAIDQVVGREPSPEFATEVAEEYERLMKSLDDENLSQLAAWKLEGFTNAEIAQKWNKTERTVERKLNLIRKIWIQEVGKQ
jgi:DNA-directed RNA polymerase specialized sigma24 family protein